MMSSPMSTGDDTVAALAARLAKREVSAVEVARDALDRIAKVGPTPTVSTREPASAVTCAVRFAS